MSLTWWHCKDVAFEERVPHRWIERAPNSDDVSISTQKRRCVSSCCAISCFFSQFASEFYDRFSTFSLFVAISEPMLHFCKFRAPHFCILCDCFLDFLQILQVDFGFRKGFWACTTFGYFKLLAFRVLRFASSTSHISRILFCRVLFVHVFGWPACAFQDGLEVHDLFLGVWGVWPWEKTLLLIATIPGTKPEPLLSTPVALTLSSMPAQSLTAPSPLSHSHDPEHHLCP